jgi:4-oxalomesaconate tautomerase
VMRGVTCMQMRGGTSKGAYFLASDLPSDVLDRDALLMAIMGTPDPRQIDGIGGAHPLTSKVAVVTPTADGVEYLFLQVGVDDAFVTDKQNCGNLLYGVAPFAIERGLVTATDPVTEVRIVLRNTGGTATAIVQTPNGEVTYDGSTVLSGVPGTAAPIRMYFDDIAGSTCGALLPTGSLIDELAGIEVTCVDNGMPVVVLDAEAVGASGDETPAELEANSELRRRVEALRLAAGEAMGLGDVTALTVPKMTLVSTPRHGGAISTRTFIPHRCHEAIGVLGGVTVATAAVLPGTVAHRVAVVRDPRAPLAIEHPTGAFECIADLDMSTAPPSVRRAGVVGTARKLFDGVVFPR